jgi:hypothetical protein
MPPLNGWQKISEFLARRRNPSLLLIALVLAGMGEKLWLGSFLFIAWSALSLPRRCKVIPTRWAAACNPPSVACH